MAAAPGAGEARPIDDNNVPGTAANNPSASMSRRLIEFMACMGMTYRGADSGGLPL
jgi:hypothetical protein